MKYVWLVLLFVAAGLRADTNEPVRLRLNLADGSRVLGETALKELVLSSEALGEIKLPLAKLQSLSRPKQGALALVRLANGDTLRATWLAKVVEVSTLFGRVSLPASLIEELSIAAAGARTASRQVLPFSRDSDWPGPRGEVSQVTGEELVVRGTPLRSTETFTTPLTVECEFVLEQRAANDGAFGVSIVEENDPSDLDPKNYVNLNIVYRGRVPRAGRDALMLNRGEGGARGKMIWGEHPFALEAGKAYKLSCEFLGDKVRLTIDDQTQEIGNVTAPGERFYIRLQGWQPTNNWRVRNLVVR